MSDKKTKSVNIRLTEKEYDALKGLDRDLLRKRLLKEDQEPTEPLAIKQVLDKNPTIYLAVYARVKTRGKIASRPVTETFNDCDLDPVSLLKRVLASDVVTSDCDKRDKLLAESLHEQLIVFADKQENLLGAHLEFFDRTFGDTEAFAGWGLDHKFRATIRYANGDILDINPLEADL